jgi:hypothetical protein
MVCLAGNAKRGSEVGDISIIIRTYAAALEIQKAFTNTFWSDSFLKFIDEHVILPYGLQLSLAGYI